MQNHVNDRIDKFISIVDNNIYISALRSGLSFSIPFFLLGSMVLVFVNIPISGYLEWIQGVWSGELFKFLISIYSATMGVTSLLLIVSVSYSFGRLAESNFAGFYPITCLVSYIAFVMKNDFKVDWDVWGPNWMFTAIVVTLISCFILRELLEIAQKWYSKHYSEGIDLDFQYVITSLFPIVICILFFVCMKIIIIELVGGVNIQNLADVVFVPLFEKVGTGFAGSILFIFLIHILWFFGIHGSNMLNMVAMDMFEVKMQEDIIVMVGEEAEAIFTKTFFDIFVLLGGSGATICLLLALIIGTKRKKLRSLFRFSIIPSIFNINEIVLFGLPVVFNPIMLIPFIIVPLVLLGISTLSMLMGLVPYCSETIYWTTPIIFSGWLSTGSWTGAFLQLVELLIGTAIYLPFVKWSEKYYSEILKKKVIDLENVIIEREETGNTVGLNNQLYSKQHEVIKLMTVDLRHALNNQKIALYYQPQMSSDGKLYGVEALLRWIHPDIGVVYPPMVIELAHDDGLLQKMGYQIIEKAVATLQRISKEVKYPVHMAVNISPVQLEDSKFYDNVKNILDRYNYGDCILCFEITEQLALASTKKVQEQLEGLHKLGIKFHMDDFGKGHSSIMYLQNHEFSAVKIDGSLTKDLLDNDRSREIISGIQQMSQSLHYEMIAEYVENEEEKEALNDLGCHIYQGYLYSPALPLNELEMYLYENKVIDSKYSKEYTISDLYI